MIWKIPAAVYQVWKDFSIELKEDLVLLTEETYHLIGSNGAGKTSFLRQVLLPQLLKKTELQYVFYMEQQAQSQLDAVKAYGALQKPAVNIHNPQQMFHYLVTAYAGAIRNAPRPLLIIADEILHSNELSTWLEKVNNDLYCLIYVSHGSSALDMIPGLREINLTVDDTGHTCLAVL